MTWWWHKPFDRRRLRREIREMARDDPRLLQFWSSLCKGGDVAELELCRLMLADLAEEMGRPVIGKMIREWTTCVDPNPKRRGRR